MYTNDNQLYVRLQAIALSSLLFFSVPSYSSPQQFEMLTKFEGTGNQLITPYYGYVYGYTDSGNGGDSTIRELVVSGRETILNPIVERGKGAKGSSGYLKISGDVTTKYQYGYAGCGFDLLSENRLNPHPAYPY